MKDECDDDQRDDHHGEDREIKFSQLLFVDLARKNGQLGRVLRMALDRGAVLLHFGQQMRRVRRRDSLGCQMPADVQISRVLLFFDGLMMAALFLERVLLRAALLIQRAIAPFVFFADLSDLFVDCSDRGFLLRKFFPSCATSFGRSKTCPHYFRFFFGQPDAPRADSRHLRVEVVGWGDLRLQFGKLL